MANFDPTALGRIADAKGLSRAEVARRLGVSVSTVSVWFAGEVIPRLDQSLQIAEWLGVDVRELIGIAPPKPELSAEDREVLALVHEIGIPEARRRMLLLPESIRVGKPKKPRGK